MAILVKADPGQWKELIESCSPEYLIRIMHIEEIAQYPEAIAFLNLEADGLLPLYNSLTIPILINEVTIPLQEMQAPSNVFRMNGWPGFLKRKSWELAGAYHEAVGKAFAQLDKKMIPVSDEPGLVSARILSMIINEAYFTYGDGVSSMADIDTAMKLGTNYPFGPFEWAAAIGTEKIVALLTKLTETDNRYQPSPALLKTLMSHS